MTGLLLQQGPQTGHGAVQAAVHGGDDLAQLSVFSAQAVILAAKVRDVIAQAHVGLGGFGLLIGMGDQGRIQPIDGLAQGLERRFNPLHRASSFLPPTVPSIFVSEYREKRTIFVSNSGYY